MVFRGLQPARFVLHSTGAGSCANLNTREWKSPRDMCNTCLKEKEEGGRQVRSRNEGEIGEPPHDQQSRILSPSVD